MTKRTMQSRNSGTITEKYEEVSFSAKAEKIGLLKEYARKNKILFYCSVNIPASSVPDFEKFLDDNDVSDDEFDKFIEELEADHEK